MDSNTIDQSQQHFFRVDPAIGLKLDVLSIDTLQYSLVAHSKSLHQLHRLLFLILDIDA